MLYHTENPHGGDIYGDPIRLDFSANTNPYGTPPGVLDAVRRSLTDLHRYPDPFCRKLVAAIAEFEQVPRNFVFCGSGAAELIYSFCQAVSPKSSMELAPTFSEYSLALEPSRCSIFRFSLVPEQEFLLTEDFLPFLRKHQPDVLFLCNPNNPTGKVIPETLLEKILFLCRQIKCRLFLDECFMDLTDRPESMKRFLKDYPELFILKAFTKSYGMAGIRLGYCMSSDEDLLKKMSRSVPPWNISGPAQAAGIAALKQQAFLETTRHAIFAERAVLKKGLENLGFRVISSQTNFLLFHGPEWLDTSLKKQGISIRNCSNYHGLSSGWYRTAVKTPEENRQLLQAIAELCEGRVKWQKTL